VTARRLLLAVWLGLAAVSARAGEIERSTVALQALGRGMDISVYVPDGTTPDGGWPVLYLLHGLGGDDRDWQRYADIGGTLDRLIGDAEIRPLLVVMPAAGDSWYVDSAAVGGPGDIETAITRDLVAAIEARWPVRRDAGGRAVAGLSMGGYGALRLAYAHPDLFAAAASLSGAIWQNVPTDELDLPLAQIRLLQDSAYFHFIDEDTVTIGIDLPPAGPHFGGAFGDPFDARLFNRLNVFTLMVGLIDRGVPLPATFVTVGDDDSHKVWRGAIAILETMRAEGQDVEMRMTDGDHAWSVWKVSIVDALRFLDAHFGPPR
jgi:S-formylglutathione hydrolase FrmB